MTAPAGMTYDSLHADIQVYCERFDDPFLSQIDRLIMLAEARIAREAKGLGLIKYVKAQFTPGNGTLLKPSGWRETRSFQYTDATGKIQYLFPRSYEYCRQYWPDPAVTAAPKFYADYGFERFLIVGTPPSGLWFELAYYERPDALSSVNQTNWTTQYAPDVLLYACLLECQPFLKLPENLATFQGLYDRALSSLKKEDSARGADAAMNASGDKV